MPRRDTLRRFALILAEPATANAHIEPAGHDFLSLTDGEKSRAKRGPEQGAKIWDEVAYNRAGWGERGMQLVSMLPGPHEVFGARLRGLDPLSSLHNGAMLRGSREVAIFAFLQERSCD